MAVLNNKLKALTPISVGDLLDVGHIPHACAVGNLDNIVNGSPWVRSLSKAKKGTVTFCYKNPDIKGQDIVQDITQSDAAVIISHDDIKCTPKEHQVIVHVADPLGAFVLFLNRVTYNENVGVDSHPRGVFIEKGAIIGKNVTFTGNNYIYSRR